MAAASAGLVLNFFSFFTIDSNVLGIVVLGIGAVLLLVRRGDDPGWFTALRAAAVTYLVTTGVVYNLLLRNIPLPQGTTVGWSNEVLHVVAPAVPADRLAVRARAAPRCDCARCGASPCSRSSGPSTR